MVEKAAESLAELGCEVDKVDLKLLNMEMDLIFNVICETYTAFQDRIDEYMENIYPLYIPFLEAGPNVNGSQIIKVQFNREDLWHQIQPLFEKYDLLVTPTTACAAFDIEERGPLGPKEVAGKEVSPAGWIGFTYPFNFTGQPAASVPCGFTSGGLPVGM